MRWHRPGQSAHGESTVHVCLGMSPSGLPRKIAVIPGEKTGQRCAGGQRGEGSASKPGVAGCTCG